AYAKRMIEMGARGYVTKNSSRNEMIKAILAVNDGKKYICDEIKNIISSQLLEETPVVPDINALSRREIEIINFIKDGFRSREIAVRLELSLKTVEVHRHNILKKLKLKNVATLVNFIHNSSGIIRKI
ncbi:MAG TPA: response regulator transcription factor, partial [Puia sp.]|nr:response regulator transcription factor [Puia sp.]